MHSASIQSLAVIAAGLVLTYERTGNVSASENGLLPIQDSCVFAGIAGFRAQTNLSPRPNGVSGDVTPPPRLVVNLTRPVAGGGGKPLAIVIDSSAAKPGELGVLAEWKTQGDTVQRLLDIPVGETVPAEQMNVFFHIDGGFHVLQMGPQPYGHCHGPTGVNGTGTTRGTIYREGRTKWVMDLPAGSIGRLFDVSRSAPQAVDRGTYYVELHFEVIAAALPVADLLQRMARTQRAPAILARYLALKRDSATAYAFDQGQLSALGYWLLDNRRPEDALIVFRLNLEEYPQFARAYAGLGEAFLGVGDTSKAISNYKRALELNPKNQDALAGLRRLGVAP